MVATFRGVDWGCQAGPFKRVNVRSHPSAPARWEWGDRCRHSVKRSGRTVQLTAVRETSRNDGRWRCWDGGLQTPENSSFGYFTDLIFILQILFYRLQFLFYRFYFPDFILQFLFYRFYFTLQISFSILQTLFYSFLIFYFTDFIVSSTDFIFYFTDLFFILQILFYRFYFILQILFCSFYFTDFIFYFTLQILFSVLQILFYRFIFYFSFILKIITDLELYCSEYSATTTTKSGKNHSRIFQF